MTSDASTVPATPALAVEATGSQGRWIGEGLGAATRPFGRYIDQSSLKNPAVSTLPVKVSISAQSGSFGVCSELLFTANAANVNPLFSTTYFRGFKGFGKIKIGA